VVLRSPSYTYNSIQHEPSPFAFPLHARQLALFALELLLDCNTLGAMPEIWQRQLNRDIPTLQAKFEKQMPKQLRFVCRHWIDLLREVDCPDDDVMAALSRCVPTLRYWVAAMGILGEAEQACRGLWALHMWLVRTGTAVGNL
jgi:hypothetical protein